MVVKEEGVIVQTFTQGKIQYHSTSASSERDTAHFKANSVRNLLKTANSVEYLWPCP
jgi:hypothetical protein